MDKYNICIATSIILTVVLLLALFGMARFMWITDEIISETECTILEIYKINGGYGTGIIHTAIVNCSGEIEDVRLLDSSHYVGEILIRQERKYGVDWYNLSGKKINLY